jgi:DNA-binding MarR family transcriptional regulator
VKKPPEDQLSEVNPVRNLPGVYDLSYMLPIHLAMNIWMERLETNYRKLKDITVRQAWVIMAARYSDRNQKHIALGYGINLNVMVKLVDDLERKGLISRVQNVKNRRERTLALTEKGRALLEWIDTNFNRMADETFLPPYSRRALEHLRHVCRAVVAQHYGDKDEFQKEVKALAGKV